MYQATLSPGHKSIHSCAPVTSCDKHHLITKAEDRDVEGALENEADSSDAPVSFFFLSVSPQIPVLTFRTVELRLLTQLPFVYIPPGSIDTNSIQ